MTILLTQDQQQTIKSFCSHIVLPNGENWYHHPFWMKDCGNGKFEQVSFEKLPEEVKDFILINRGIKL